MSIDEVREELKNSSLSISAKKTLEACLNIGYNLTIQMKDGPFICGAGGPHDSMNLPDYVFICPKYGMDGMATYKKVSDYSAPGY
jgi:hypothetical protein